jgi:hypothetical protein
VWSLRFSIGRGVGSKNETETLGLQAMLITDGTFPGGCRVVYLAHQTRSLMKRRMNDE